MQNIPWKQICYVILAIALIYLANFGYRWWLMKSHSSNAAVAAVTDQSIQKDVEQTLAASDAYAHEKISVAVHNGEVILTGTVHEQWKQDGAANIASAVAGV